MFLTALRSLIVLTLITGGIYPVVITVAAQIFWPEAAKGSVITVQGKTIGSTLFAQTFTRPDYFWPRPSAADFGTLPAGASNLGPTSQKLQGLINERRRSLQKSHGLDEKAKVPDELLLASGSGLDPHISPEVARFQAKRVALARALPLDSVLKLIETETEGPQWKILGAPRVNVLLLNLALERQGNTQEGL